MRVSFLTCDVFTETRFGGNPLAVVPDARGLTPEQMQQVAREFNYSESTFVLPAERGGDRRVRIFTPAREVPFAGHPNVGTAFVLAALGEVAVGTEAGPGPVTVVFEEAAGDVPVSVTPVGEGRWRCELRAPESLSVGPVLPVADVAAAAGLDTDDLRVDHHRPVVASVGLPFVIAELRDLDALGRAQPDVSVLRRLAAEGAVPDLHLYVRVPVTEGGADIRARMFAPLDGVPEDPATGSANGALAGLLASIDPARDTRFAWRIAQGVEMGRPSLIDARVEKADGEVAGVWIGGESVLVARGEIEV